MIAECPPLWTTGVVPREKFLVFLNNLLESFNWSGATKLYAQLIYQTHHTNNIATPESTKDILTDALPALPLPDLSEPELLGVFFALHKTGLNHHALALWKYFDVEHHHGVPLLKPHAHYYSSAFEKPYSTFRDVRNVQLLMAVFDVADLAHDTALVYAIFERLVGGLLSDVHQDKATKAEIPATPLWHVSYFRQLRTLEIALSKLDPKTQGERIISYINTYRLKFATCWTPKSLLKFYSLLDAVKTHQPELAADAALLEEQIKKLSYKIATHETLQAIRNEDSLRRIRESFPERSVNSLDTVKPSTTTAPQTTTTTTNSSAAGMHPGLVNLIARAIELSQTSPKENYQVIKQIYLECFEMPYYFTDLTSITESALKHFVNGNDGLMVSWIYQHMLEQGIELSVNARNQLMFWALRTREDPTQCIEFFNDLLVAFGPQAANGATFLLLFEAVQENGDLDAAKNAWEYIREHAKSRTILKQAMETTLNLAMEKGDTETVKILSDEMSVKSGSTYADRWRPKMLDYAAKHQLTWVPPAASSHSPTPPSFL